MAKPGNHTPEHMKKMSKLTAIASLKYKKTNPQKLIEYVNENEGRYIKRKELLDLFGIKSLDTLSNWRKQHEDFDTAYQYFKQSQEDTLVHSGLYNKTNSQFTQFILKNNFGYNDKQIQVQTTTSYDDIIKELDKDDKPV